MCTAAVLLACTAGHGGKQSATYTSRNLLPTITGFLDRGQSELGLNPPASGEGGAGEVEGVWATQEVLIDRLPKVQGPLGLF